MVKILDQLPLQLLSKEPIYEGKNDLTGFDRGKKPVLATDQVLPLSSLGIGHTGWIS
jgi:hypothetical protein